MLNHACVAATGSGHSRKPNPRMPPLQPEVVRRRLPIERKVEMELLLKCAGELEALC